MFIFQINEILHLLRNFNRKDVSLPIKPFLISAESHVTYITCCDISQDLDLVIKFLICVFLTIPTWI